jgi:hypothetical protein
MKEESTIKVVIINVLLKSYLTLILKHKHTDNIIIATFKTTKSVKV